MHPDIENYRCDYYFPPSAEWIDFWKEWAKLDKLEGRNQPEPEPAISNFGTTNPRQLDI